MKRIFSVALSLAMLLTSSGLAIAEENQALKNLKDKSIKRVMQNTLIIRPGALNAFVYGKNYNLEDYGEVTKDNGKLWIDAEFLKSIFPENNSEGEKIDLYEFASRNGMKLDERDGNYYLFDENYNLPAEISSHMTKFFGVYVKEGSKGTGTYEKPLGSIQAAKNTVSSLKNSVGLPDGGITVYFREGKYVINNTVIFTEEDSGMEGSPICYKAYKNENPAFNGGITIKGSEFEKVTDINVKNKLPYPDKVAAIYIGDKIANFSDSFKNSDPANWALFYSDQSLTVARWPNHDWALTGEILMDSNRKRGQGFSFVVGDTRIRKWGAEDDPRIFGYFGFDWAGERRGIASVDAQKLSILTDDYAEYGISTGKRYYTYNMLCELDNPGEFYYDKKTDYLYFYPVEGNPKDSRFLNNDVQFALHSQELMTMKNTSYVDFEGMTFENSLAIGMDVASSCTNINIRPAK